MNAGRWASFILLPLAALLEAAAWYGARAMIPLHLRSAGADLESVGTSLAVAAVASLVAMLISAIASVFTGPWIPTAAGMLLAAIGLFAIGVVPPGGATLALALASFGHGLAWPALYGAAARAFPGEFDRLRDALFLLVWAAVVLGGDLGPAGAGSIMAGEEAGAVFFASGAIALFAFTAAGTSGIVVFLTARRTEAEPSRIPVRGAHLAAVIAIVLVTAIPDWARGAAANGVLWLEAITDSAGARAVGLALASGQLAGVAVAVLVAAIFVVLHNVRARAPTLLIAGVALVVLGIGTMLVASSESVADARLGLIVGGIGAALFMPLLLSRMAGDMPLRLETAAVALFMLATGSLSFVIQATTATAPAVQSSLVWAGSIAALVIGLALTALSPTLSRLFFARSAADA